MVSLERLTLIFHLVTFLVGLFFNAKVLVESMVLFLSFLICISVDSGAPSYVYSLCVRVHIFNEIVMFLIYI